MAWFDDYSDDEEGYYNPFNFDYSGNFGISSQPSRVDNMFGDLSFGSPDDAYASPLVTGRKRGMFGAIPDMPAYNDTPENAYYKYLQSVPNRSDYERGPWGKVAAAMLGAATGYASGDPTKAYAATQGFLDQPYKNAIEDYKIQGTGKEAAMKQEQLRYNRAMSRYLQGQENARKGAQTQASIEQHDLDSRYKQTQIDKMLEEIQQMKNPQDWKQDTGKNGELILINSKNGKVITPKTEDGQTIQTNAFTFDQRKQLDAFNNNASLNRTIAGARERGAQDRQNITLKGQTDLGEDIVRDALGIGKKSNNPHIPTPTEQADQETLNATRKYRDNPNRYKALRGKGIKVSGNSVIFDPESVTNASDTELQLIKELFPATVNEMGAGGGVPFIGGKRRR